MSHGKKSRPRHHARAVPYNREAEIGILGAILIDNRLLAIVASGLAGVSDFYVEAHQRIYECMLALSSAGSQIDMTTLSHGLRGCGELEAIGGVPYLSSLIDDTPTTAALGSHTKIVADLARLRRVYDASLNVAKAVIEPVADADKVLDDAEREILGAFSRKASTGAHAASDIAAETYEELIAALERGGRCGGLATGYSGIDSKLGGLAPGDLVIVAGRPSMGKTALALNVAWNAARTGAGVLMSSLEMSRRQLMRRMLSFVGGIEAYRLKTGSIREQDLERIRHARNELAGARIFIDDAPALTIFDITSRARAHKLRHGLDLYIVDYLQLIAGERRKGDSREQEVSEISRKLKGLARELEIPVIALSQLNRGLESRENKRPRLSDLRESGAIEQDADTVAFVYRDEVYDKDTPDRGMAEFIVAKQRSGSVGTVHLRWIEELTLFSSLSMEVSP